MPRPMSEDDATLYRARYTLIYPIREDETISRTFTQFFGPYRTVGAAKSAIKTENRSRNVEYYEREGIRIDTDIEKAEIQWVKM